MTKTIHQTIETATKRAEQLGKEHGENAAEWAAQDLWGGRFTGDAESAAREFLRMSEDGDPILWDRYKAPDLSGEWADNMTPWRLMSHCFDTEDDFAECADAEDEICLAYEDAATSAFWQRLEESAANILER
jgi:hypothetical protein